MKIDKTIADLNAQGRKALSVFLTAGFPDPQNFVDLAVKVLDGGADLLEIGIPFSDPIADGPVIQQASRTALSRGVDIAAIVSYCREIRRVTQKPLILMGYANPVLQYGLERFLSHAAESGVDGLIVPDIPLEEFHGFWNSTTTVPDIILLTTPTTTADRIREIDRLSRGFVYCVSVTGTTGARRNFNPGVADNLRRTRTLVTKNKMFIGFGISHPQDVRLYAPFCDGVIVGSAVIKKLIDGDEPAALELVGELARACHEEDPR